MEQSIFRQKGFKVLKIKRLFLFKRKIIVNYKKVLRNFQKISLGPLRQKNYFSCFFFFFLPKEWHCNGVFLLSILSVRQGVIVIDLCHEQFWGFIPPVYILQEMLYKGIDQKGLNTCILTFWKKKQIQYNVNVTPVYSWKYKVHQHEYCLKSKRTVWLNVLAINSNFMIVQVYSFHHFRFFKLIDCLSADAIRC